MHARRPSWRRRVCRQKRRFPSEAAALAVLKRGTSAYHCAICEGWHRTSHPLSRREMVRRAALPPIGEPPQQEKSDD